MTMKSKLNQISALTLLSAMMLAGCMTVGKVTLPEPSAAFAPKQTYAVTQDKLWDATLAVLEKNRIATISSDKTSGVIQTDTIAGPTTLVGGFLAAESTRYKYNIKLRSESGGTFKLNILCKLEASVSGGEGSSQWNDVTVNNAARVKKLEVWLYEQIEKEL